MLKKFQEIKTMGVINITPNSFSDPSKFLDRDILLEQIKKYKNRNLIFDFGFESSAPMNRPITLELERERFDRFFDSIGDIDLSGCWISFDTYRPKNYLYFEEQFKSRFSDQAFIFNDVSGVIDQELLELLSAKKKRENFYYVHSFAHIPSRDKVLDHMTFLYEGSILDQAIDHFSYAYKKFKEIGVEQKIIFDPGLGFSKTFEQNWELIDHFDRLVTSLDAIVEAKIPWLIGLSKKSFLRATLKKSSNPFLDSEIFHEGLIKVLLAKKLGQVIFRVHDFDIVDRAILSS